MSLGTDLSRPPETTDPRRSPEMFRRSLGRPWLIALLVIPLSFRRSLGLPWLIALVVIPLLIAVIGYGALDRPAATTGPTGVLPTLTPPNKSEAPKLSLAPLSIVRNGNDVALSGNFPDDSTKLALIAALKNALGPGINIIDQIIIDPKVDSLDFSNAGVLFRDSASIPDFNLTVNGNTIILAGTTGSQDEKIAVERDAATTWSGVNVVDSLAVTGTSSPGEPGSPPPPPAACPDLPSAINAVTGGQIAFGEDGFSLTPADEQSLSQVAEKLKACPSARATINGYSDDNGTEAINIALSSQRAQKVADYLAGRGVPSGQLVVRGLGSVTPVAPNDTAGDRAKNRRVEIVVS
uniref:channel-forming protein ArfA/OmpATb n=1 Tax=Mycobacterium sp. HUMS_1102779 TaxID=3383487 RepID=UPI00389AB46B